MARPQARPVATGAAILGLLVLAGTRGHADVTITPGIIHGTIAFTADVVPTSVRVDAVNPPNESTRYPSTVTVNAQCAPPSGQTTFWCYSITVESALTHAYYVRPVFAYTAGNVTEQIALPEFPQSPDPTIAMPTNGNVTFDIAYQPAVVTGATGLSAGGQPLPGQAFTLIAHDDDPNGLIFPDPPCGPSIGGNCLVNSNVRTDQPTYELYLKPGRAYSLQQASGWTDGSPATGNLQFDFDLPYTAGAAGSTDTRSYSFTQQASVSGTISINALPLSAVIATVQGGTTTPPQPGSQSTFGSGYSNYYLAGATSSPYIARVFNNANFGGPFSLLVDATFTDGSFLQAPLLGLSLSSGDNLVVNYNAAPAFITGSLTFNPVRQLLTAPKTSGLHVASNNFGVAAGYLTVAPQSNGGTFSLPVIPDSGSPAQPYFSWQFPAIAFDLGPNFSSNYVIDGPLPLTPSLTVTQAGQSYPTSLKFDTAFVDVFFTAAPGTLISDPFLDAVINDSSMAPLGYALFETAHGEGLNQSVPAQQAEAQLVLRVDPNEQAPFVITPSALVTQNGNTSRAPFSPFSVVPTPGGVIKVAPPLVLSVSSPIENQQFDVCTIPATGTAGGAPIASVTISIDGHPGVPAATSASPIPGDPNRVSFSLNVTGVSGPNTVAITAADTLGDSVTQTIHVTCAQHNPPPTCKPTVGASVGTALLWPPNHDLVNIGLAVSDVDSCDPNPSTTVAVFSNESDQEETGSGNFSPDAKNLAAGALRLRSERKGDGNGRVYLIIGSGLDSQGQTGFACTTVVVPHDQSQTSVASITQQAAAARAYCNANSVAPSGYVKVGVGPIVGPKQ